MSRFNKSEVDGAIHSTKDTPVTKDHTIPDFDKPTLGKKVVFFTFLGDHDYLEGDKYPAAIEDNDNVLAKKTSKTKGDLYEIKFDHHNQMFNPVGLYTNKSDKLFMKKRDKDRHKFVKVNKDVFDNYVQFLTTKNTLWLNRASRLL